MRLLPREEPQVMLRGGGEPRRRAADRRPVERSKTESDASRQLERYYANETESRLDESLARTLENTKNEKTVPRGEVIVKKPGRRVSKEKCEKCDGAHATDRCPWFRKDREKHPDAALKKCKRILGYDSEKAVIISRSRGRIIPQPPDGSCLFHSLGYGLSTSASLLRREIAAFIRSNPDLPISDTPLKDWIQWESLLSVAAYTSKMAHSGWGGGVELAATAELKNVTIEVYEPHGGGFKRISVFHKPSARSTVRVLYRGGVHYDALVLH